MNYGMKVAVKYNENYAGRTKEETLNNVTEIHYNYESASGNNVAFESDIHGTGCTRMISEIKEFEAITQDKKEKEF